MEDDVRASYEDRELTREQKFIITLLKQRMWNSCIIAKQNAIECKVAIYGNNG